VAERNAEVYLQVFEHEGYRLVQDFEFPGSVELVSTKICLFVDLLGQVLAEEVS
jgi:hypothetical protein